MKEECWKEEDLKKENLKTKEAAAILHQRTVQLSQTSSTAIEKEKLRLVEFKLQGEWWALEIRYVKEVVKLERITPIPGSSPYISGITNLRGSLLSVINTKKLFGLPSNSSSEKKDIKEGEIIVVELASKEFGLLVDRVLGVVDLPLDSIEPPLSTLEKIKERYIQGEAQWNHHLIGIFEMKNIFGALKNVS